jgi:hypothetical protein
MQVFHGSDIRIENIDLSKSEYFKDFGRGFYVTNIREQAYLRALDVAKRHNSNKPVITEYKYIETYPVTVGMKIKRFENVSKEWVEFIILNRNRQISHPAHTFDVVEGPIANDKMVIHIRFYGDGKNIRDWVYVEDHVRAVWDIMQKGEIGGKYNVGGENEWENIKLVGALIDIVAKKASLNAGKIQNAITFVKDRSGHDRH